jgi:uncharacterized protein (DUF2252 family)
MFQATIPLNFDGAKFATKYGLSIQDFYIDGDQLHSPIQNLDLSDCITTAADFAELASQDAARDQLKAEYISAIATLTQIENAVSPTNAQVTAAVKYLAKTLRLLLKLLVRQFR